MSEFLNDGPKVVTFNRSENIYQLVFCIEVFNEAYGARSIMRDYLEGKIKAIQACKKLGWDKKTWDAHLSGLFSIALNPDCDLAEIWGPQG